MTSDLLILSLICLANISLGLIVYLRNIKSRVGLLFLGIAFLTSLWLVSSFLTDHLRTLPLNEFFNKAAYFVAYVAVLSIMIFSYSFPLARKMSGVARTLLFASPVMLLLSLTPLVAGGVAIKNDELIFTAGTLLPIYVLLLLWVVGIASRNFLQAVRRSRGRERQQALLVLFGFVAAVCFGLITNAIIPLISESWSSTRLGPLSTLFIIGSISYAIIRHRLFDIRLVVARAFAYLLSVVALAIIYAIMAFGIFSLAFPNSQITPAQELFFAFFSATMAFFFQPLRKFFDKVTNKVFYHDAYDPQAFIDQLNRTLVSFVDLEKLLSESSSLIRDNFKAEYCAIVSMEVLKSESEKNVQKGRDFKAVEGILSDIKDKMILSDELDQDHLRYKSFLEREKIEAIVPIASKDPSSLEVLGVLILGPKKSGAIYNSEDVKMMDIIANGMAVALQNALRFQQIQNFNLTLQAKVDDATKELRRKNDRLRLLDRTKDDFISMASHQLRTPLTSVKGYVSMVLDGDAGQLNEQQRKLLNQSFVSSQRMAYLISDLLNVSRLRTGKFIIEATPCDLSKVIDQEVSQLIETAKSRELTLTYHKPENFPTLVLDENKLRQVIMNFIDNAIYYTPGGGHIDVYLEERPESIEFKVVDDGIGVPRQEQHHLFSKFYRAGNAQRMRPDGTGLGIFMAKKVVISQGGAVIFKSKEGKGSTFGFVFPKAKLLPTESKKEETTK